MPALTVTRAGADSPSRNAARFTDCVDGELHGWLEPINDRGSGLLAHSSGWMPGSFNAYQAPGQTEELCILDVEGTRVVLVSFDSPASPAADIAERNAMFDSIRIELWLAAVVTASVRRSTPSRVDVSGRQRNVAPMFGIRGW